MFSRNKAVIFLVFFILIAFIVIPGIIYAQNPATPTIIDITSKISEPLEISGLTPSGTDVLIYIDGNFTGLADIISQNTETDNFVFNYPSFLEPGEHSAWAVARDRTSLQISSPTDEIKFNIEGLPAPTLIAPNENTITGKVKPDITGLSLSETFVHIWIDGVYNGKTGLLSHESGTANFAYQPFLNLDIGEHTIIGVAEDRYGRKSLDSRPLKFRIEPPMPAPVIYKPVVNNKTTSDKPFIVGVAKNDSIVNVYIDKVLYGQIKVKNQPTGTSNFAYQPFVSLKNGNHLVYTEAIDSRGKVSRWSNIVYFTVTGPVITGTAEEDKQDTTSEITEPKNTEEPTVEISPETGEVEKVEVKGETGEFTTEPEGETEQEEIIEFEATEDEASEVQELLNIATSAKEETAGLLDESRKNQGGLRLNLVIFIIFLLTVIAWIFWVNRELIKERRALTEAEDQAKKNKNV